MNKLRLRQNKVCLNGLRVPLMLIAFLLFASFRCALARQAQTGPDAVPSLYTAKYLPDDSSCPAKLARYLWGTSDDKKQTWWSFDPKGPLSLTPLPQMNPFLAFGCDKGKEPPPTKVILHGSLWRINVDGTFSQSSSQWQVYHTVQVRSRGSENSVINGLLSEGYSKPKPDDGPKPEGSDAKGPYSQPAPRAWIAKSPLYNDKTAKFIGLSCFYDWDGYSLEDPQRIKDIVISYKIGTASVVPDNLTNLGSLIGALFPGITQLAILAAPKPPGTFFVARPVSVVPGDQVRLRLSSNNIPVPQKNVRWTAVQDPADPEPNAPSPIDDYGTLKVPRDAKPGTSFKVKAEYPKSSGQYAKVYPATNEQYLNELEIKVPDLLPCFITSGDVQISSLPSDINITMSALDGSVPLTITTISPLGDATSGNQYTVQLLAKGGGTGQSWSATGLPSWLQLSSDGKLSGTPNREESDTFTVTVKDGQKHSASQQFELRVTAPAHKDDDHRLRSPAGFDGVNVLTQDQHNTAEHDLTDQPHPPAGQKTGGNAQNSKKQGDSQPANGQQAGTQQPGSASDCSSVASSGCTAAHTVRAYDRQWWDVGLGLAIPGVREPQYAASNPAQLNSPIRHTDVYGFINLFPFAALGNKTSYYPSLVTGIPVTGKVFYRLFFGLAENITGWRKLQDHAFPIQVNILAGLTLLNQEIVTVNPQGGGLRIQHSRVWKGMFGIEVPIKALVGKIASLGGSGSGGGGKAAGGGKSQ